MEVCMDDTATDHSKMMHNLFAQFLQGAAATKWTAVFNNFPLASQTAITSEAALMAYLEKLQRLLTLATY
eukprot:8473764-Ditylum_brightwellii.AAC.1